MMHPILVIEALAVSHRRPQPSTDSLDEKFELPHLLRLVILMSMRPSLSITNLTVCFGAWIVYHFGLRIRMKCLYRTNSMLPLGKSKISRRYMQSTQKFAKQ